MAQAIALTSDIITSDKTPRTAIGFDRTSGVKQLPTTIKRVLLVGQRLSTGTQPVATPVNLYRETDTESYFLPGSMLDVMAKAAYLAYPNAVITAVAVDDAPGSVAATATLTFAGTATMSGAYDIYIAGRKVVVPVNLGDTPTVIAASAVTWIAAALDLPVTATNLAGVVTITAKNKGDIGNRIAVRGVWESPVWATAAGTNTTASLPVTVSYLAGGTGVASLTAALASVAGARYHEIAIGLDDTASGQAAQTHAETNGDAEHGNGQAIWQASIAGLATATTQATTINGIRNHVVAMPLGSESWTPAIAAAAAATCSSEEVPTRPLNTMVLNGIKPPPVQNRWLRSDLRNMLDNGVTPLKVFPGEKVGFVRAVTTYHVNTAGNPDYSILDKTIVQAFDYVRDALVLMFDTNYGRSRWADDDPDGLLPPDAATPSKVASDILNTLRDLEEQGIVSGVEGLASQIVVNKVGTQCQFSVPANIVDGMHEKLGKVVLIRRPLAA